MARYTPGAVPYTEDIHQLERYLDTEQAQIRNSTDDIYTLALILSDLYVIAGYGGIGLDAETPVANITATPQVLPFDVELLTEPRGVTYVLGSQGLQFNEIGIWRMNAKVSLTFTELNAGRRLTLRLYNVSTASDVGPSFNFAVGRNTDGVNLNFNLLVDIPEEFVDNLIVMRVSSAANTFTGVTAIGSIWDANHVSEYKRDLFNNQREILGVG